MYNPCNTYRIQLHKGFTLAQLESIIPYLRQIGIKTVYASPIFESVPGSMHGYDCVNPHCINPEIGTEQDLRRCIRLLKAGGIGWLQDIVPNHMAFHPHNHWLMDVLKNGKNSEYAFLFDIFWDNPTHEGKLMVPFLGAPLDQVVEDNELHIARTNNEWVFRYFENEYPLNDHTAQLLASLSTDDLNHINQDKEKIKKIADAQYYALCHWQETDTQINYRRFFTVNGLICLHMEDEKAFSFYHRYIGELLADGLFDGLRVDHVDGLYNPGQYLQRLRALAGKDCYIIVEKILQQGETLPPEWPVQGNTGYDFLSWVNNLLTQKKSLPKFNRFYQQLTGELADNDTQLHGKKAHILFSHMAGELDNLHRYFLKALPEASIEEVPLKLAIGEFLSNCPVYRYYGDEFPLPEAAALKTLFGALKKQKPALDKEITAIEKVLSGRTDNIEAALHFYRRCMQLTGPLMAKGMEDTLMYTHNSFIAHNEVGDTPFAEGLAATDFHRMISEEMRHHSLSLNATATHDTKRGEDIRARLNALSDIPYVWINQVKNWIAINKSAREKNGVDINDEYFIYQTLAGSYPIREAETSDYLQRLKNYLQKALREAKTHSDWAMPNVAYENAVMQFLDDLLDANNIFCADLKKFTEQINDVGIIRSLAQVLIKYTVPGIPDLYQGCELWDYNFVDPDNRRPVDFQLRADWLAEIIQRKNEPGFLSSLWQQRDNGKIKLWLIYELLQLRSKWSDVFEKGDYIPLKIKGQYKGDVLAFARRDEDNWIISITPIHTPMVGDDLDWADTKIILPVDAPLSWQNIFTQTNGVYQDSIPLKEALKDFLLSVWVSKRSARERSGGILMHVTSLPAAYGIGDLGPEAFRFVDFLKESLQRYWQILPLNPTVSDSAFSPYSSISAFAGNPLLISPDLLEKEGLLEKQDLKQQLPITDKADFILAQKIKNRLLNKAYKRFLADASEESKEAFNQFTIAESQWLNDFALFVALKKAYENKHWIEWPDEYKHRDEKILTEFSEKYADELSEIKWQQFIFFRQWQSLKAYCQLNHIKIFGDLPFYVSYDSVETWSHPEIFCLNEKGQMTGISGVPPDYFSDDGQLWGMPTYNWQQLKADHYRWWIYRLKKNLELYDLLRLDHFRAFVSYWQVDADANTARFGRWLEGPGLDFFKAVEKELGKLPFVAEDLGDNMEQVYELRDRIPLPGMRVLQFAFGNNMPVSVDIPHNYNYNTVVYTGTHDNNTTLGWYREETKKSDHKRMQQYAQRKTNSENVHMVMSELAYASVAAIAILPIQDVLGLDETHRMNTPGTDKNNWTWRILPSQLTATIKKRLMNWVRIYNR